MLAQLGQDHTAIVVEGGNSAVLRDGLVDELYRQVMTAGLMGQ